VENLVKKQVLETMKKTDQNEVSFREKFHLVGHINHCLVPQFFQNVLLSRENLMTVTK
jgi:hypothetical protein